MRISLLQVVWRWMLLLVFAGAVTWPHFESDIAPDPSVRFGSLENGLRYAIMPNSEPANKLSLRLHIAVGSLMEKEHQLGLAHFLEHMVFNGSRNFASGELIPIMQRLGVAFGSHVNAYTSFHETVYMLDLPNTDQEVLDMCFMVLRDFADGALLDPEEIEKERNVILSELSARDSVSTRILGEKLKFMIPDHLLPYRFPAGIEDTILSMNRSDFVEFYEKYYIPSRITFVVVGDANTQEIEDRVISSFGSMENPPIEPPEPDLSSGFDSNRGLRSAVMVDKEVGWNELQIMVARPFRKEIDSASHRQSLSSLSLANLILNTRLSSLANKEGSPISWGSTGNTQWANSVELGWIQLVPVDFMWEEAVVTLENEFRRAIQYGFTHNELMAAKSVFLNEYRTKVSETRRSRDLASAILTSTTQNTVFSTPENNFVIVERNLGNITEDDLRDAFNAFWSTDELNLITVARTIPENSSENFLQVYRDSMNMTVSPPEDVPEVSFAYTDFGSRGTVVEDTIVDDMDINQLVLSNQVRVNLKKTDFEETKISIVARFGTGILGLPQNQPGLSLFTRTLFENGGLGVHSTEELSRVLAGRNVAIELRVEEGSFVLAGETTADDLQLQLQLMAAHLLDSGYREEGVQSFRKIVPAIEASNKHKITGAYQRMETWLHGFDHRFELPEVETLLSYEAIDAREWVQPQLLRSYLEISLIGNLPENTVDLLLDTVGALPERESTIDAKPGNTINFPATPDHQIFMYESKIPQAGAVVVWKVPPLAEDIDEVRQLSILSTILRNRLFETVREELGASYSPSVTSTSSKTFEYGVFTAFTVVSPDDAEKIGNVIVDIADQLAQSGASEDEFDRAIEPTRASLTAAWTSNSYWLHSVMSESQAKPHVLDWARSRSDAYMNMTVGNINSLASAYLKRDLALRVELLPTSPDGRRRLRSQSNKETGIDLSLFDSSTVLHLF